MKKTTSFWLYAGLPALIIAGIVLRNALVSKHAADGPDNFSKVNQCLRHLSPGQEYEWKLDAPYGAKEVKTVLKVIQVESNSVTFQRGMSLVPLDRDALSGGPHDFLPELQTVSRTAFAIKDLLDCR